MLGVALEPVSGRVGDVVETGAGQPVGLSQVRRFLPLAATVFQIGCRSAHLSDDPLEQLTNRFAGPRIGHGDGDTGDGREGAPPAR